MCVDVKVIWDRCDVFIDRIVEIVVYVVVGFGCWFIFEFFVSLFVVVVVFFIIDFGEGGWVFIGILFIVISVGVKVKVGIMFVD